MSKWEWERVKSISLNHWENHSVIGTHGTFIPIVINKEKRVQW